MTRKETFTVHGMEVTSDFYYTSCKIYLGKSEAYRTLKIGLKDGRPRFYVTFLNEIFWFPEDYEVPPGFNMTGL